jgi:hypothetical protein
VALDSLISSIVYSARLLEKLAYDSGPWYAIWGGIPVHIERIITDEVIVLRIEVPPSPKIQMLEVYCGFGNDPIISRKVRGNGAFQTIDWEFQPVLSHTG